MNIRERFKQVMEQNNTTVPSCKWEFGYWGEAIDNWYEQGLPRKNPPVIPDKLTTPTASLYMPCWHSVKGPRLPAGIAVLGHGLYHPSQGFPLDSDVREALDMDIGQVLVDVNLLFHPMFEVEVVEEDDDYLTYIDVDGVTRRFSKATAVIPAAWDNVIKDKVCWEKLKDERLNLKDIKGRFPADWSQQLARFKKDDCVVTLGGYPQGYFGTLAHLMGYERLFYTYADDPEMIHDIQATFTKVWMAVYEEVFKEVDVDLFVFWEDMSAGSGSMVSPATIKEFMVPYYKKMTDFLRAHGVQTIFIDTDGYCMDIIPLFVEAGINGMYPIEVSCGMDLVEVRKQFPELCLMGGIPKSEIRHGAKRIDEILEPVAEVLKTGRYVPFGDHLIPPEVPWEQFKYYRRQLNRLIDNCGQV